MKWTKWIGACLVLSAVLAFGCKKADNGAGNADTTNTSANDEHADGHSHDDDHGHADEQSDEKTSSSDSQESEADKIAANLAKLSDADRALAEKQKVCPVSGEALGEMGAPIKIHVKDQDVFICCKGCEKPIKEDPDKYLAKLQK